MTSIATEMSRVPMTLREPFFQDDFFKNSWEDFEKLRSEMMKQSQDFWKKAEQEMKALESSTMSSSNMSSSNMNSSNMMSSNTSSNAVRNESSGGPRELVRSDSMAPSWFFPRSWMMPRMFGEDVADDFFNNKMKDLNLFSDSDKQVIRMKDADDKFEISLDTHDYRPDEIKVNVSGGTLSVEAKHEEKGDNKFVSKQFSRKYTLPEGCEASRVNSNLSSDGILVITAPKKAAIRHEGNRAIPVEVRRS
jgi:HSP20 family molecular chaperone IbpA